MVVPTILANLTFDAPQGSLTANYGWPLYWYWAYLLYSPRWILRLRLGF